MWVHGPPGSGKTSLAASYVQARRLATCWYRTDRSVADPESFVEDLADALGARGRSAKTVGTSSPSRLFRRLAESSAFPDLLVIDGFEAGAPGLSTVLASAVDAIPETSCLLVLSREVPASPFARLRLNGQMRLVGWPELALTEGEARALARALKASVATEVVEALSRRTRGWMAGFRLLLRRSSREPGEPGARNARAVLHDYFATEVMASLPGEARTLLLRSALPARFTPRVFHGLDGRGRAEEIFASLLRKQVFLEEIRPGLFEYHELFREFLLTCERDAFRGDDSLAARRTAARLLAEEGLVTEALELYQELRDWPALAGLLARNGGDAPPESAAALGSRLRDLPDDATTAEPALAWARGVGRLAVSPERARPDFERALAEWRARGDDTGFVKAWCGVVESFLHGWSDFAGLDPWLGMLDDVVRKVREIRCEELHVRVATCAFAALSFRRPGDPSLAGYLERALDGSSRPGVSSGQRLFTLLHATLHVLWIGDMARASVVADRLDEEARSGATSPLTAVVRATIDAIRAWFQSDARRALDAVQEGLRLAGETGAHAWDHQLLGQGAYAALLLDDVGSARTFVDRMRGVLREERTLDASHFHHLNALVSRAEGDRPGSTGHAERALALARTAGAPFPQALNHVLLADLAIDGGSLPKARRHLALARATARDMGSRVLAYTCDWTAASLALASGDEVRSRQVLRRAIARAREEGFGVFPWMNRDRVSRLLARELHEDVEASEARRLAGLGRLAPPYPEAPVRVWPRDVEVFALGCFEVRRAGRPLEFGRKVQRKPLELLKVLVAFGGTNVSAQRVADVLWPELDGAAGRHALATTLHRLRQLVACDHAIVLHEGRLSLDPDRCWVDAQAFERLLDAAAGPGNDPAASVEILAGIEQALDLYRGDLLHGEPEVAWAVSARERLRSKFLRFVVRAGQAHERVGSHERAIELYRRGLEVDGLAEDLYVRLVEAFARLGRRAEALAAYRRACRVLAASLGVAPSERLEAARRGVEKIESVSNR